MCVNIRVSDVLKFAWKFRWSNWFWILCSLFFVNVIFSYYFERDILLQILWYIRTQTCVFSTPGCYMLEWSEIKELLCSFSYDFWFFFFSLYSSIVPKTAHISCWFRGGYFSFYKFSFASQIVCATILRLFQCVDLCGKTVYGSQYYVLCVMCDVRCTMCVY